MALAVVLGDQLNAPSARHAQSTANLNPLVSECDIVFSWFSFVEGAQAGQAHLHDAFSRFVEMQFAAFDPAVNFATADPANLRRSFRRQYGDFLFAKRTPGALRSIGQQFVRAAPDNRDFMIFNCDFRAFAHSDSAFLFRCSSGVLHSAANFWRHFLGSFRPRLVRARP